ncbi:hypothetical protein TanjilG_20564 [Lupinus angustifolius]|uniref:Uncharacterized protein n=1 Tax=Lupinus angustifolius TaxID=3871 RepID=A0A1J7GS74_LUPAN|nr:hypothetical protein TanjilG_20564 [Lupinus angustifolius]
MKEESPLALEILQFFNSTDTIVNQVSDAQSFDEGEQWVNDHSDWGEGYVIGDGGDDVDGESERKKQSKDNCSEADCDTSVPESLSVLEGLEVVANSFLGLERSQNDFSKSVKETSSKKDKRERVVVFQRCK